MNEQTYTDLFHLLMADGSIVLAIVGAWLDPFQTETEMGYDDDTELLSIGTLREYFFEEYIEYNRLANEGVKPQDRDQQILDQVNQQIPCEAWDLDSIAYGIPLEFLGVGADDERYGYPNEGRRSDEYVQMFNISHYDRDPFDGMSLILSRELEAIGETDQSKLVDWLFAQTGNSITDFSNEESGDNFPEGLTWDQLDFALEMYGEAEDIHHRAMSALDQLDDDAAFAVFCSNAILANCIAIQEVLHDHRSVRPAFFQSRRAEHSDQREAAVIPFVLPVWDRIAA